MANEITVLSGLVVNKGTIAINESPGAKRDDMAGDDFTTGVVSIPTTAAGTAISLGLITTAGLAHFKNLDLVNYIELGIQTGGAFFAFIKLKPGKEYTFRLGTNTPFAKANTAACKMKYVINED